MRCDPACRSSAAERRESVSAEELRVPCLGARPQVGDSRPPSIPPLGDRDAAQPRIDGRALESVDLHEVDVRFGVPLALELPRSLLTFGCSIAHEVGAWPSLRCFSTIDAMPDATSQVHTRCTDPAIRGDTSRHTRTKRPGQRHFGCVGPACSSGLASRLRNSGAFVFTGAHQVHKTSGHGAVDGDTDRIRAARPEPLDRMSCVRTSVRRLFVLADAL